MAVANKCDRCGAFYDFDFAGKYSLVRQPERDGMNCRNGFMIDLCPACDEALDNFMKLEPMDISVPGIEYSVECGAKRGLELKESYV